MSYDALRKGRHSQHHQVYCITTVTRDRHPLFTDINAARLLVHELRRLHENGDVTSLAWVIMPDHLHWLIQLNGSNNYAGRINSALQKTTDPPVGSNSFDQTNGTDPNHRGRINSALQAQSTRPGPVGSNSFDRVDRVGRINSALQKTTDPTVGSNSFDRFNRAGRINSAPGEHWPLSRVVKTLKARSAQTINRYLCHSGSLWQRAYYDRAARKDEDIRHIARYIIANPLRAGLAQNIGDYPHWDYIWMDLP